MISNKSKVALVYPPINPKNQAIRDLGLVPPLHLLALAAVLRDREVRIIDGAHIGLEGIIHEINRFQPEVIGMNVDLTNYENAVALARAVPGRVILGGNYAAFLARQILANQPRVEAICFNDGEEAIRGFANGSLDAPNLIHRGNLNPKIKLLDISALPTPAYDLVDMEVYFKRQRELFGEDFRMMQFYGQKGCVNLPHCTFCGRYEDGMRLRNPEIYAKEVEKNAKRFGLTEVWDRSDSFLQNRKWFLTVQARLKELKTRFKTYARADQLDEGIIDKMKEMGFRSIYIGYEAGDDSLLAGMNKHETTKQYIESSRKVLNAGIDIDASFIVGLPGENLKTLENQVRFVEELSRSGLRKIKVNRVLVLPGTPLYERVCSHYPEVRGRDITDISEMQGRLYSTYDLSDFGGSVCKFTAEINGVAEKMTSIILNKGGCAEGYGYEKGKIGGGKEI